MFPALFFPLFTILAIAFVIEQPLSLLPLGQALKQWILGMGLYAGTLLLIYGEAILCKNRHRKERMLLVVQGELLIFLLLYHFFLSSHMLFLHGPFGLFFVAFFSIVLYLLGYGLYFFRTEQDRCLAAWQRVRFLLPLFFPLLLLLFLTECRAYLPWSDYLEAHFPLMHEILSLTFMLLFLGGLLLFMPLLLKKSWSSRPLKASPLKEELERLAKQANFSHAGFYIWHVFPHSYTAAILGILPSFRYILFSEPLLNTFSQDELKAVLAHEIGHSKKKHLLFYPLILCGMIALVTLCSSFVSSWIDSLTPPSLRLLTAYTLYVAIIALYVRFVFGFFSRQFERQADLYPLSLGLSLQPMIHALNHIAFLSGEKKDASNWHHFSAAERVAFLQTVEQNPLLAKKQDKRVKIYLWIFTILLTLLLLLIYKIGPS